MDWALSVGAGSSILQEFLRSFVVNRALDQTQLQFAIAVHPSYPLSNIRLNWRHKCNSSLRIILRGLTTQSCDRLIFKYLQSLPIPCPICGH
jgi:hypothetical protein